jgi:hypothetical protein
LLFTGCGIVTLLACATSATSSWRADFAARARSPFGYHSVPGADASSASY